MSSTRVHNCYSRNGPLITDRAYQPCNDDTSRESACCGTNHSGAGHVGIANDVCEPNGLCQNFDGDAKMWWRQGCTDPTWQSELCLSQVCDVKLWGGDNVPVRDCGGGTWCCGNKCCGDTSNVFELAVTVGLTATSSSTSSIASVTGSATTSSTAGSASSTAVSTSAGTRSATPSTSSSTALSESEGLSTGVKAGIGAGVGAVAILIAIIAFLLLKLKKRHRTQETYSEYAVHNKPGSVVYAHQVPYAEVSAYNLPEEMSAHGRPAEMSAHGRTTEMAADGCTTELDGVTRAELPGNRPLKPRSQDAV